MNANSQAVSVKPDFRDASSGDYSLKSTSSLIDAGTPIAGINDEYVGNAPDIGAFELR